MALNLPNPPSYAGGQMGATVDANPLSALSAITNIGATQQSTLASQTANQRARATMGADIAKAKADARSAESQARTAEIKLGQDKINSLFTVLAPHASDERVLNAEKLSANATPQEVEQVKNGLLDVGEDTIKELVNRGFTKAEAYALTHDYFSTVTQNPSKAPGMIKMATQKLAGAANIAQQNQPAFTTNQAGQFVRTTPAQGTVQPIANATYNPNPSSAQVGMTNKAAETYSSDYATAQNEASAAQSRIALYQNIKKLAPEAFTGVGGQRKELAAGIANAVGIPLYEAEKMSTDELAKNSALLSLAGGNTDAARLLAEAANPNKKMNEKAIKQVADQLIGVEKLKMAKANFLAPVANDPIAYQQRLNQFNQVNDFRIFQESTPEEVAKLKASMSKEQQAEMSRKIKTAREMGLIR
jgi:hypothetical protein